MNKAAFFIGAILGSSDYQHGISALDSCLSQRTNRYGTSRSIHRPAYDGKLDYLDKIRAYDRIAHDLRARVETQMLERLDLAQGNRKRSWATYERISPEEADSLASEPFRPCSESECMLSLLDKVTEGLTVGVSAQDIAEKSFNAWVKEGRDSWIHTGIGGLSILDRPAVRDFKEAKNEVSNLFYGWWTAAYP